MILGTKRIIRPEPTMLEILLREATSLALLWKNDPLLKKQKPIKEKRIRRRFKPVFTFS